MSQATRQTNLYGIQDWQSFYQTIANVDLQSYDFETLRKSMIDYIKLYNPENYNDYITSSEFIALIDLIAFMGQSLSFRFDLNARENFLQTAQSRDAIIRIAEELGYQVQRNSASNGYLKFNSISINDNVQDSLGNNLNNLTINWNDPNNSNWLDQWNTIINATITNAQTVGNPGNTNIINGINIAEYTVELPPNVTSPFPFNATIDNTIMNFEAINASSLGQSYIYEKAPNQNTTFTLLYKNDSLGYASNNTGYFFNFKQGTLTPENFSIATSLPNQTINLNTTGVNNDDVWLFQQNSNGTVFEWTQVQAIYGQSAIYNSIPAATTTVYSVNTRSQDAISLTFGDGIFGQIPLGNFICYERVSNGLVYRINPNEMSNIQLIIPYINKFGRAQQLTVSASLLYTIANSAAREDLNSVKIKAPQSYYTQNRMVNGQDYNSFPFTQYNNILNVKAINRTSSGVSRYLDIIDPTGQYSSTNTFCNDGFIYQDPTILSANYSYNTRDELASLVENQIVSSIFANGMLSFFNENYPALPIPNTAWNLVLNDNTSSSGYIYDTTTNSIITTQDSRFSVLPNLPSSLVQGAILEFIPPTNFVFDINNNLVISQPSGILLNGQKSVLYVAVQSIVLYGMGNTLTANGINVNGSGAIQLSQSIPSGAILNTVFPLFIPQLENTIIQEIINALILGNATALTYNPANIGIQNETVWNINTTLPLNYNPATYGTSFILPTNSGATVENSWMIAIVPNTTTSTFTVYLRNISYYFGSVIQTSFYTGPAASIYNLTNGSSVFDTITILQANSLPGQNTNLGFPQNINMNIIGNVNEINGTLDPSRVQVSYTQVNQTGTPDNPFFFNKIVGSTNNSYVFFVTDNINSTTTILPNNQVTVVASTTDINNNLYSFSNGQIIFTISNSQFYSISRTGVVANSNKLNNNGDQLTYTFYYGRQNLNFQYIHNAPSTSRIDPSPSNIIDIYVLEQSYANDYQAWATDNTGQVPEPIAPTTNDLYNNFAGLEQYKMFSDLLIFNPVQFVPLFGSKAASNQQANFVVVPQNIVIGTGEIQSQVITAINNYFAVGNFDFGETFYWSDLSTYLHTELSSIISSISLVPISTALTYGDLQQILCNYDQILTSCATVNNVIVVSSLNNINLRIG